MKTKLRRRLAISTVITTIIILVASVVLGSGVVLYSTSLFQTGTLSERIAISGVKVWVHETDTNGLAWGAFGVRNSGDTILSLDKISIRSNDVGFSDWYSNKTVTTKTFDSIFTHPGWSNDNGGLKTETAAPCSSATPTVEINFGDGFCANAQTGPLSLGLGEKAVVYFKLGNGTLSTLDAGANTNVQIFAGKAGAPLSVTVKGQT